MKIFNVTISEKEKSILNENIWITLKTLTRINFVNKFPAKQLKFGEKCLNFSVKKILKFRIFVMNEKPDVIHDVNEILM